MTSALRGEGTGRGIAAAVFDLDGLLADTEPIWHEVEIDIFGRHGVPLTVSRCLETKGMFLGDAVEHWYAQYPWPDASPQEVAEEIVDAMVARVESAVKPKAGALGALDFCESRGARLALASSSAQRLIDAVVQRLGLHERFAVMRSAEDEPAGKPHPGIFITTARLLEVEPAACVVFEDSPAGVLAAKAAGMVCVAVPEADDARTQGNEALASVFERADIVLASLEDLGAAVWSRAVACSQARPARGMLKEVPGPGV
jgi:sugar-phosphatase